MPQHLFGDESIPAGWIRHVQALELRTAAAGAPGADHKQGA